MTMNVLDVSNYQSGMALSGYDAYIFKATEGIGYTDKYCDGYVQQAKKLGKPYGVYHFLDMSNVKQQAQFFYNECKGYLNDAMFILDFETYGLPQGVAGVQEFCSEFTRLSGINCVLYMSESIVNERTWNKYIEENHAFWVAKYSSNKPVLNNKNLTMIGWQYTDKPLDKSYFYVDAATWNKYANKKGSAPVTKSVVYQDKPGLYEALKSDCFYLDKELSKKSAWTYTKGQKLFFGEVVKVGKYTRAKIKLNNDIRYCTLRDDYWKLIYNIKETKIN